MGHGTGYGIFIVIQWSMALCFIESQWLCRIPYENASRTRVRILPNVIIHTWWGIKRLFGAWFRCFTGNTTAHRTLVNQHTRIAFPASSLRFELIPKSKGGLSRWGCNARVYSRCRSTPWFCSLTACFLFEFVPKATVYDRGRFCKWKFFGFAGNCGVTIWFCYTGLPEQGLGLWGFGAPWFWCIATYTFVHIRCVVHATCITGPITTSRLELLS